MVILSGVSDIAHDLLILLISHVLVRLYVHEPLRLNEIYQMHLYYTHHLMTLQIETHQEILRPNISMQVTLLMYKLYPLDLA